MRYEDIHGDHFRCKRGCLIWTFQDKFDNMSHIVQENQVWRLFSHTRQDKENGVHTKQQEEQDVITSDNFDYNLIYK
jgi:hypothetical protein